MSQDQKHGECYKNAFHAIMDAHDLDSEVVLVHGYPRCTAEGTERFGKRFGHAWLERDGIVFDASSGKLILAAIYYAVGQIDPEDCQRYSWREAAKLACQQEHYGPWQEPPPDAMFGNQPKVKRHFAKQRKRARR